MKKVLRWVATVVAVCIIAIALNFLTGCADALFATAEYRTYQIFAENHKIGMEKQEIIDTLGSPDGYYDAEGTYQSIKAADRESFKENVAADLSSSWAYVCWKRHDPADPYRLIITFDAEGKSLNAELTVVPGG